MEPIDTYGGEGGNGADDIVLLSHPNPTTPLHHVTLTAKPHAFAGAVLTPKHARELTPALVLSVVVSLAEQASSTKGGSGGGGGAHGSASVTGSISGAPAAGGHHVHTPSGASSIGGGGHGGVPPPPPSPSLPHSPPSHGRRPSTSSHASAHTAVTTPGVANADAAFRTIQPTASTDSGFGGVGGGGGGVGGMAAGGGAPMPLSPNAVAAKFCESKVFAMVRVVIEYLNTYPRRVDTNIVLAQTNDDEPFGHKRTFKYFAFAHFHALIIVSCQPN